MRLIGLVVLVVIAWWVGASGLFSMDDAGEAIDNARDKISEDTQ